MLIANPIYDTVFRYLMGNLNVAKLMLSVLLEKEIVELEFLPSEILTKERKIKLSKEEVQNINRNPCILCKPFSIFEPVQ